MFFSINLKGQVFDNPGFENTTTECPGPCYTNMDLGMGCLEGWWNYSTNDFYFRSFRYGYDCLETTSCGGNYGLELYYYNNVARSYVTTRNPFFGTRKKGDEFILSYDNFNDPLIGNLTTSLLVYGSHSPTFPPYGLVELTNSTEQLNSTSCTKGMANFTYSRISPLNETKLKDYEYLVFSMKQYPFYSPLVSDSIVSLPPSPPLPQDRAVILDNMSLCQPFKFYPPTVCNQDEVCFRFEFDETCGDFKCGLIKDENEVNHLYGCQVNLTVDGVLVMNKSTLDDETYCLKSPGPGSHTYEYAVTLTKDGIEYFSIEGPLETEDISDPVAGTFYTCPSTPATTNITSNTIWDQYSIPNAGYLGNVTVAPGYKLTIEPGTIARFCDGTKLQIGAGARLDLYGTLTSACSGGWSGIEVLGTSNSQQPSPSGFSVLSNQGSVFTYAGAIIENANIGIKIGTNNTTTGGGVVQCTGTEFMNNTWGIVFYKYDYNSGGIHSPNKSFFTNCNFLTDQDYFISSNFTGHVKLNSVDGIPFTGCLFNNTTTLTRLANHNSVNSQGTGISSYNSGFYVSSNSVGTKFTGLNTGIKILAGAKHFPISIDGAEFDKSYNGIENFHQAGIKVDGCTFRYNENIPSLYNDAQIGIYATSDILGQQITYNLFQKTGPTNRPSLGIISSWMGTFNNIIDHNNFSGLSVSNEAIGRNGIVINDIGNGLQYQCNNNTFTQYNDFFLPGLANQYGANPVQSTFETVLGQQQVRSAGNSFSKSLGAPGSKFDWRNDVGLIINYFYDNTLIVRKEPLYFSGLNKLLVSAGPCSGFILNPDKSLATITSEFNASKGQLKIKKEAIAKESNSILRTGLGRDAGLYQSIMNQTGTQILSYYWNNSARTDSIRTWLLRLDDISGDIIAANLLAYEGNVTAANAAIESAKIKYSADAATITELNKLKTIYAMSGFTNPDLLSVANKNTLRGYTTIYSAAGAIARGLLSLSDEFFPLDFVLPNDSLEIRSETIKTETSSNIVVFPNPSDGLFRINIPQSDETVYAIEVYDILGNKLINKKLNAGINELDISYKISSGVLIYNINDGKGNVLKTGKLIITK